MTTSEKPRRIIQFLGAGYPASWPRCPSDKLSIFEAIQIVGRAKFGPLWDGTEVNVVDWPISRKDLLTYQNAARSSGDPKSMPQPKRLLGNPPVTLGDVMRSQGKLAAQHDAHVEVWRLEYNHRKWENNQFSYIRLINVCEWIAQKCRDKELISFARPSKIGDFYPMFAWEWNAESIIERYVSKGVCNRFFPELKVSFDALIFFDRADIDRLCAILAHAPSLVSETDLSRLSPYLQFAVRLALAKDYTSPEKQETNDIRQAEIKTAWLDFEPDIPLSDTMVRRMAFVMGFPDSKAIRQGQSAGQKRGGTPKTAEKLDF